MPTYKLSYLNVTGLGEPLRFLLSYGGADFEDNRINFEDWPKQKPKMPMEQVPILEFDGKIYHQTRAIGRFLAKKYKLYGNDELQDLEIDLNVDDVEDWRTNFSRFFREADETQKAKLKAFALEKTPFYLGKFEERVKKNGGYFVAGKLSWADVHFAAIAELINNFSEKNNLESYPALTKLYETVRSEPKIKAYLEKRPKTVL
ncbi:glutathione S-transferase S5 [Nasonia vitripennis]|uniref:glutathione transferase n=1 Tax=Nasonia vitripennis TaxID=7425 RepID=K7J2N2_NASVI|nr:glutathione S-transferase S5 [Nasonia vitripennis]NP_001165922.1 glutathione S-transferase S5 [Nasonia vitripennis]